MLVLYNKDNPSMLYYHEFETESKKIIYAGSNCNSSINSCTHDMVSRLYTAQQSAAEKKAMESDGEEKSDKEGAAKAGK